MGKTELIKNLAAKAYMSQSDTKKVLEAFLDEIATQLEQGEEIQIVGFGTFKVVERAARNGRNPRTGEIISIPATKTVAFKSGEQLKNKINGK